ncbi:aminopeptidase P family protein [Niveibacterium sp. SC-1]|uniref:aminopeptidase P family protein n=1 Tax=Niveibacterium sp. SC-1 TaxID=3135646 RepID=UPI00311E9D07
MSQAADAQTTLERLAALRGAMARHDVAGLILPSSDPHLSEYLPAHWQARQHFSGFTGSMGTLVVTADFAGVWADSRYWEQAERELAGSGIALMKIGSGGAVAHFDWLAERLPQGATVAVDGQCLALGQAQQLRDRLAPRGITLRTELDIAGEAWAARPSLPAAPIFEQPQPYADRPRAVRLALVREAMAARSARWHVVSSLDDVAWILGLRGSDVPYNPVFLGHLLIGLADAQLFVDATKLPAELKAALATDGVRIAPYFGFAAALAGLPAEAVLLDPARVTLGTREALSAGAPTVETINPSTLLKSRKTDVEAAFVREAMERDGAAMCAFYAWFEAALGHERITELTIDERLSAERARQPGFVSLSFPTIAGFNANGALPHYRATEAAHAEIAGDGLLLIDSGGQYLGGTTDITRVWAIGQLGDAQRRDCTLVLKGMIALSRARFPRGTLSPMLDAIARAPIWAECLDYDHGTGHGVGYLMNVHEGPQSISKAVPNANMAMEPGMITSNEPGLYRPGQWGVRIENLLLNVPVEANAFGDFLGFETLTLCPIDLRCIDTRLLDAAERAWLDAYHAEVLRRLRPHVSGAARDWLEARTASLGGA